MSLKVSVVIPAYNEESVIEQCLKTLLEQSYKSIQVIVVDDGSTDNTRKIIKKFKKVLLIEGEHKGPGFSRNLGATKAKGDILVFVDADMHFDKDYIHYLIKPITSKKGIGSEERVQMAANVHNIWSRCWGQYTKDLRKNADKGYIFRAILRKEFEKMKGFDPKYGYADDLTFYFKYGVRSIFADKAICYHRNPETLKEVYKQSRWIGASLQNKLFKVPIISHLIPIIAIPLAPLAIPALSIRKCHKNNSFSLFFPMLAFMTVRYFGAVAGIFRRVYLGNNIR